ncbi:MAG: hypothetical protein ACRD4S_14305 [Candidatus Acidiferrales bacterium]
MKHCLVLVLASALALPLLAQQSSPVSQPQTIQMECRDLTATGNYIGPDETLINGRACRQVHAATQVAQSTSKLNPQAPAGTMTGNAQSSADAAQPERTLAPIVRCVILKRMGPADEVTSHMYSFGIRGKQFQYVEGELPAGVKFHGRLTDNDVRNIQSKGGHVVIMEPKYTATDLREAKQGCKEQ